MKRTASLALACLAAVSLAAACPPTPNPPPPGPTGGAPPVPVETGGTAGAGGKGTGGAQPSDACELGQRNLERLGCPERTTPKGTSYAVTCRDSRADGRPYPEYCIINASSCDEARHCR